VKHTKHPWGTLTNSCSSRVRLSSDQDRRTVVLSGDICVASPVAGAAGMSAAPTRRVLQETEFHT
jgi:hypothetical protein